MFTRYRLNTLNFSQYLPWNTNDVVTRLSNAKDPEKEGIDICIEQINTLKTIPGVSGAHLIASEQLSNISTVIKNANI